MIPRHYHVQLTTHRMELYPVNAQQALLTALELAGPGAVILSVTQQGEW